MELKLKILLYTYTNVQPLIKSLDEDSDSDPESNLEWSRIKLPKLCVFCLNPYIVNLDRNNL